MRGSIGRWLLLAALSSGLTGCQERVAVEVVEAGGQVRIAVTPRTSSATPCVARLAVYRDGDEATAIWEVSRARDDQCVSRFTVGVVPAGFEAGVRSTAPIRGVRYQVDVSGTGFRGGATFVATGTTA